MTFGHSITFDSAQLITALGGNLASISGNGTPVATVNLSGVATGQTITVKLLGVTDGHSTSDISVSMSVLVGDTGGNGVVNASDVAQTGAQSGSSTTAANFRTDVNLDGRINVGDTNFVKSHSGTGL